MLKGGPKYNRFLDWASESNCLPLALNLTDAVVLSKEGCTELKSPMKSVGKFILRILLIDVVGNELALGGVYTVDIRI